MCDSRAQQPLQADGGAGLREPQWTLLGVGEGAGTGGGPPLSCLRAEGEGEATFLQPPSSPPLLHPHSFQLQFLRASLRHPPAHGLVLNPLAPDLAS